MINRHKSETELLRTLAFWTHPYPWDGLFAQKLMDKGLATKKSLYYPTIRMIIEGVAITQAGVAALKKAKLYTVPWKRPKEYEASV